MKQLFSALSSGTSSGTFAPGDNIRIQTTESLSSSLSSHQSEQQQQNENHVSIAPPQTTSINHPARSFGTETTLNQHTVTNGGSISELQKGKYDLFKEHRSLQRDKANSEFRQMKEPKSTSQQERAKADDFQEEQLVRSPMLRGKRAFTSVPPDMLRPKRFRAVRIDREGSLPRSMSLESHSTWLPIPVTKPSERKFGSASTSATFDSAPSLRNKSTVGISFPSGQPSEQDPGPSAPIWRNSSSPLRQVRRQQNQNRNSFYQQSMFRGPGFQHTLNNDPSFSFRSAQRNFGYFPPVQNSTGQNGMIRGNRRTRTPETIVRSINSSDAGHRPYSRQTNNYSSIAAAIRQVTEKEYKCETCGRRYASRTSLKRHIRSHTGERMYSCSYCGKLCPDMATLNAHVRKHTGEKPFVCPIPECGRRFSQKGNCNRHVQQTHGSFDII